MTISLCLFVIQSTNTFEKKFITKGIIGYYLHVVVQLRLFFIYIRVVRRALILLRASFSPIFQYFLTCMPAMPCMLGAPCAMDSSAMESSAMEGAVHSHRDFRVRKSVVHRALNWLVTHNQYYRCNHVHIDVNALEQLPHDGNLSQLTSITVESASTEPPATNTPATGPVADTPATSEDPYSAHLPQSFVSIAIRSMTEQEAVHQSVQERIFSPSTSSSPATMMWPLLEEYPSMSSPPKGYFSCAFPTLFPTGTGDFSGQRQNQVAKHPCFRFFALNTEM